MNSSGMKFESVEIKTSWNIGVQNILLTFPSKVEFFSNVKISKRENKKWCRYHNKLFVKKKAK
jgi:hypothetical protein